MSDGGGWPGASPPRTRSVRDTRLLLVSVVVLVALLGTLGFGALMVVLGAREAARAATVATAYCGALQRKQYDQAYALLSPAAQRQTSSTTYVLSSQFHDAVDGPITRCDVPQPGLGAGFAFSPGSTGDALTMRIIRRDVLSGSITLAKVGASWRVSALSPSLQGTDVTPLVVEHQFCAALEANNEAAAAPMLTPGMRAQTTTAALATLFGNSDATALTGCQADPSTYRIASGDASAQVTVPLAVSPKDVAGVSPLVLPVTLKFIHQSSWSIAGVQLALPNLPPVTSVAPTGASHLPSAAPAAPALSSQAAMLIDPTTNTVLLAQNADTERAMASTTKIMTTVVALSLAPLDQAITVTSDVVPIDNGISSVAGLQIGDVLSVRDLLYALLLPSGDDAAVVLAHGIAGSQPAFVALMNMEAGLLGLRNTHYADVHGLDMPGHYTSARDLLTLTEYAMRFAAFDQIVASPTYQLAATGQHHAYAWTNTNLLLGTYSGATGVKTGFTGNAGSCLVFSARRGSHQLLGVVLGEPSQPTEQARFTDATALLNWGFALEQQGL